MATVNFSVGRKTKHFEFFFVFQCKHKIPSNEHVALSATLLLSRQNSTPLTPYAKLSKHENFSHFHFFLQRVSGLCTTNACLPSICLTDSSLCLCSVGHTTFPNCTATAAEPDDFSFSHIDVADPSTDCRRRCLR